MTPVLLFTFSFKPVSFWLLSLKMYKSKVSYFIWLQRKITFMKQKMNRENIYLSWHLASDIHALLNLIFWDFMENKLPESTFLYLQRSLKWEKIYTLEEKGLLFEDTWNFLLVSPLHWFGSPWSWSWCRCSCISSSFSDSCIVKTL